ncbi:hypothetical protein GIB67_039664, partial [Kingdonia uniflora]
MCAHGQSIFGSMFPSSVRIVSEGFVDLIIDILGFESSGRLRCNLRVFDQCQKAASRLL